MNNNMDFEAELSKVTFQDETFVNKAVIGKAIIEHIRRKRRQTIRRVWFAAASVAAVIMVSAGYVMSSVDLQTGSKTLTEPLPDGSYVQVQEHSRLKYNRIVWLWKRNVTLDGQARFTVAKGSRFTVHTGFGNIAVRGTEFFVATGSQTLGVECYSGSVEVITEVGRRILEAGDRVECSPDGMEFTPAPQPIPPYLKYSHTPLTEILAKIEQLYNVTVTRPAACDGLTYDGVLPTGNLDEALNVVLSSCGLGYTVSGNRITISAYDK